MSLGDLQTGGSPRSWRPRLPEDGTLRNILTAVITASLISAGGTLVAVKVQERDIESNSNDLDTLQLEIRDRASRDSQLQTRITKLETEMVGNERVHDGQYVSIERRLKSLQDDLSILLRRRGLRRPHN